MTQTELKLLMSYNPDTGIFTYIRDVGTRMKAGDTVGGVKSNGYVQIKIAGKRYLGHRLAWLYMTGEFPEHIIDHIDHDVSNNSWNNLRLATHSQNQFNRIQKDKGVNFNRSRNKWLARAIIKGQHFLIGAFDTKDEAKQARFDFAELHHGEFCCNT